MMKNVSAIITADLHAYDSTPVCRLDEDYIQTQIIKWRFIERLRKKHKCPILHAGDLTENWKCSPFLLGIMLKFLPNDIITIPGNHDLPAHKIDRIEESGLYVLWKAGKIQVLKEEETIIEPSDFGGRGDSFVLYTYPWRHPLKPLKNKNKHLPAVAMVHTEVYQGRRPYPGADPNGASIKLLRDFPDYDLIISGHNHQSFESAYKGNRLVNPGSIMRMSAGQETFKSRVFLWDAGTNTLESINIPIDPNVISREHIDIVKDRDERMDAFISRLNTIKSISLHYETNLEKFFAENKVRQPVQDLVWEFTEKENR